MQGLTKLCQAPPSHFYIQAYNDIGRLTEQHTNCLWESTNLSSTTLLSLLLSRIDCSEHSLNRGFPSSELS